MKFRKEKIVALFIVAVIIAYTVLHVSLSYSFFEINNSFRNSAEEMEQIRKDNIKWIETVDSVYTLSDDNYDLSIEYLNKLAKEKVTDTSRLEDIYYIKANLQYQNNRIEDAIQSLDDYKQLRSYQTPKYAWLKAGCLIKQGQFDEAESLIKESAKLSRYSNWLLGNFYEIKRDKQKALEVYRELLDSFDPMEKYAKSPSFYSKCADRIEALNKENPDFLDTIIFFDDRKRTLKSVGGRSFIVGETF